MLGSHETHLRTDAFPREFESPAGVGGRVMGRNPAQHFKLTLSFTVALTVSLSLSLFRTFFSVVSVAGSAPSSFQLIAWLSVCHLWRCGLPQLQSAASIWDLSSPRMGPGDGSATSKSKSQSRLVVIVKHVFLFILLSLIFLFSFVCIYFLLFHVIIYFYPFCLSFPLARSLTLSVS